MSKEKLTIDIDKILNEEDSSITNPEVIRQISYHLIYNDYDEKLSNKIDSNFEVYGLYPHLGPICEVPEYYMKND